MDFQITNTGSSPTGPFTPTLFGPDAVAFALVSSACDTGLAVGASCTITVEITPTPAQHRYVASVHATLGERTFTAPMIAVRPFNCDASLEITPTPAYLRGRGIGTAVTGVVTVDNPGLAATGTLSVGLGGVDASLFAIVAGGDACTGAALAPAASCTVEVRFTPTAAGTFHALLTASVPSGLRASGALVGTEL